MFYASHALNSNIMVKKPFSDSQKTSNSEKVHRSQQPLPSKWLSAAFMWGPPQCPTGSRKKAVLPPLPETYRLHPLIQCTLQQDKLRIHTALPGSQKDFRTHGDRWTTRVTEGATALPITFLFLIYLPTRYKLPEGRDAVAENTVWRKVLSTCLMREGCMTHWSAFLWPRRTARLSPSYLGCSSGGPLRAQRWLQLLKSFSGERLQKRQYFPVCWACPHYWPSWAKRERGKERGWRGTFSVRSAINQENTWAVPPAQKLRCSNGTSRSTTSEVEKCKARQTRVCRPQVRAWFSITVSKNIIRLWVNITHHVTLQIMSWEKNMLSWLKKKTFFKEQELMRKELCDRCTKAG